MLDLYVFAKDDGGKTAVHILDGASNFQSFLLRTRTILPDTTDPRWQLRVGDFDADGRSDIYAVDTADTAGGGTSVHVLGATSNFQTYLLQQPTAIAATDGSLWDVEIGDFDGDGRGDLYAINKDDSGSTAVHVLDAESLFQVFTMHTRSAIHATTDGVWLLRVGDYDGDGRADLFAINRDSNSRTDVHVIDASVSTAASAFGTFSLHAVSGIHATTDPTWDLLVPSYSVPDGDGGGADAGDNPSSADVDGRILAYQSGARLATGRSANGNFPYPTQLTSEMPYVRWPACGNFADKFRLVAKYQRPMLHSQRMVGGDSTLRCGLYEGQAGISKFGWRHISDKHGGEWGSKASMMNRNWQDLANFALEWTIYDPDMASISSDIRYCYQREFAFYSKGEKVAAFRAVVILGKTGIRIMTAWPQGTSGRGYCYGGDRTARGILRQVGPRV